MSPASISACVKFMPSVTFSRDPDGILPLQETLTGPEPDDVCELELSSESKSVALSTLLSISFGLPDFHL